MGPKNVRVITIAKVALIPIFAIAIVMTYDIAIAFAITICERALSVQSHWARRCRLMCIVTWKTIVPTVSDVAFAFAISI